MRWTEIDTIRWPEIDNQLTMLDQRRHLVWNLGGLWIRVNKILIFLGKFPRNFDCFRQFYKKFRFLQANFTKNFDFPGKFSKNFKFFRQIFKKFRFFQAIKKIDFPGRNCSFTATSGQIILFRLKSHHFRTYFLFIRVEWTNQKFEHWNPIAIKSCLMAGTQ